MAITYGFFNSQLDSDGNHDRVYNAEQMSTYFKGIVSTGVYESVGGALLVKAGTGMKVKVQTGRAILGENLQWFNSDSIEEISLNPSHVTLNRYTAIAIRLDITNRRMELVTIDSAYATSPIKPQPTRSPERWELFLAYVYIEKGVNSITQSKITDIRADNNVCGWVTGVIKQVDTSQLFLQWQKAYEEYYSTMLQWQRNMETNFASWENSTKSEFDGWQELQKMNFNTWFTTLTGELKVDTYIEKYQNTVINDSKTSQVLIGIGQYDSTQDISLISLNGITLAEGLDYEISENGADAKIILYMTVNVGSRFEFIVIKSVIGVK